VQLLWVVVEEKVMLMEELEVEREKMDAMCSIISAGSLEKLKDFKQCTLYLGVLFLQGKKMYNLLFRTYLQTLFTFCLSFSLSPIYFGSNSDNFNPKLCTEKSTKQTVNVFFSGAAFHLTERGNLSTM
jgi:hypothetical protein